jgi:hypothetical protein
VSLGKCDLQGDAGIIAHAGITVQDTEIAILSAIKVSSGQLQ